jgi:hypothetical protein
MEGNEMSEGINRRMVLGATGATLALASCKGAEKDKPVIADITSACENHGDSPRLADGTKPHKDIDWMPEHYCVVYVNMDGGDFVAKHAYYPTGFQEILSDRVNPSSKKAEALATLKNMADNKSWLGTPMFPGENFENFWFGSQQEIYIFVDGNLAKIDPDILLVFSKNKTKQSNTEEPQKNKTFYNAQPLKGAVNGKDVTFVQNWFATLAGDKKIQKQRPSDHEKRPKDIYAMNIHILLGSAKVPGVIDPDTGNGAGNEP